MLSRTWSRIALSYVALVLITAGVLAVLLSGEYEGREEDALCTLCRLLTSSGAFTKRFQRHQMT